jgi:uncharacterized protein
MKLSFEQNPDLNLVTGYGAGHVMINKVRHDGNLMITADRVLTGWAPGGFDGLTAADFAALLEFDAEVVIIGTGSRLRFPATPLLRPLIEARVGYEIMDFAAACRTYNILATEGRAVVAALLFDAG